MSSLSTPPSSSSNLESKDIWGDNDTIETELVGLNPTEIRQRATMLTNNARILRSDINSLDQQIREQTERVKDNTEKIKLNKQLPYLVANVVEVCKKFYL